ncbi:hypothetical protein [Parachlamydia sp. AcF125]|uniref:hypothetical protein n=1 Tax=Parachlamydia sp. AcF125 TaxID=2795736 RepID=UPI001BC9069E|nr:hypothetical protein [Parachlamydia sp. AcF125]MBS4168423.1 Chromosome partition protein Smc [Parachlamydia sp. AcF125]
MKINSNPSEDSENPATQSSRFSEPPSYSPKKKQRKTAIGLSVATCLLMGIIGFEIIRDGKTNSDHLTPSDLYIPSQTAILTAAEKEKLTKQTLVIQQLQQETQDDKHLIKNLSEEVQNLSYELLHAKVDLFGYQLNPEQQAKIEALQAQIQEARQNQKELENSLQNKHQVIASLQQDLENSKKMVEEKNKEILALHQVHEALNTRLAAENFPSSKQPDELGPPDSKLAKLEDAHEKLEFLDKELGARELALKTIQEEYDQLLHLHSLAQAENEKTIHLLQMEIQALHSPSEGQSELVAALINPKSQELAELVDEKNEYDPMILAQKQEIENFKALELSLQENIEKERAHSQSLANELAATLFKLENLEKEQANYVHLAEALQKAEENIEQLKATIQAEKTAFKDLQEDYQAQIASNEMFNHSSLKSMDEREQLTSLLAEKQSAIENMEQEVALLHEKYQALQDNYLTALDAHESTKADYAAQLEIAFAQQKEKELASHQLEKDAESLTATIQGKETDLARIEQELQLLHGQYQELNTQYLLAVAQQESAQAQLSTQTESALALQKEKETEALLLQEKVEHLASLVQEKEILNRQLEQEILQFKESLAHQETSQKELGQQMEQTLVRQKEHEEEAKRLQEEFQNLTSILQNKEQEIQTLQAQNEDLQNNLQGQISNQKALQLDLSKQIENSLALQKEQEEQATALKAELQATALSLAEKELHAFNTAQEILLLQEKYQELQNDYLLTRSQQENLLQELTNQIEKANGLYKGKEQEALLLEEKLTSLTSEFQNKETLITLLEQERNQLKEAYQEIMVAQEHSKQALANAMALQNEKEKEVILLQEEVEELTSLLQAKEAPLQDKEKEGEEHLLQDEIQRLSSLLKENETYLGNMEQEVQLLQDKHRELLSGFHTNLANQEEREQELHALESELKLLSSALQGKETHITRVEDEIQLLQDKHRELQNNYLLALTIHEHKELEKQQQAAALQKDFEHLTALLQERDLKIASMEHSYQTLVSQKESEALSLQQKIEQIEREFSAKKQEQTDLINQLENSHTEIIASDEG